MKQSGRQILGAAQIVFLRAFLGLGTLKIRNTEITARLNVKKHSPRNLRISELLGKKRRKNEKH
jgi:hypothetical protein